MARKASVRYWTSREGYCCWHESGQVMLARGPDDKPDGPTYKAALMKFDALVNKRPPGRTVDELLSAYLRWAKENRSPATAKMRRQFLRLAGAELGRIDSSILRPLQISEWIARERAQRHWEDGTVHIALSSLRAAFAWGVRFGMVAANPLSGMETPPTGSRGMECVLTPEQEARVLGACKGPCLDFVTALRDTGARPGEIAGAEAKHFDARLRVLVYSATARRTEKRHKTIRTGRPRVIYLTGQTLVNVESMVKAHPDGPIFRTSKRHSSGPHKGQRGPWSEQAIARLFRRLREATGVEGLIPYSFRHTYAVRWLRASKPAEALAEVMGTSVSMIRKHYGHLADQHDYLHRLVRDMNGQAGQ